jgi:hypothetical protein
MSRPTLVCRRLVEEGTSICCVLITIMALILFFEALINNGMLERKDTAPKAIMV